MERLEAGNSECLRRIKGQHCRDGNIQPNRNPRGVLFPEKRKGERVTMPKIKFFNCFEVKNETATSADLYFYGDIVSDYWGAWQEEDQYPEAIKNFKRAAGKIPEYLYQFRRRKCIRRNCDL